MTGFNAKRQMSRDKLDDDDDTQVYADTLLIVYQRGYADGKAAQRPWVGLTDDEIHRTTVLLGFNPEWETEIGMAHAVVRNLEAKLKERNT